MKCSDYTKSKGVKSLKLLSEKCNVQVRTLQNWYTSNRILFDIILNSVAKSINDSETSDAFSELSKELEY